MKNVIIDASNITNYQAVNCHGKELGIVEDVIHNRNGTYVQLSTHYKDLFGNIKYAVPFDLCDIDHSNKTIWLNIEKSELEFLYKLSDLYENRRSSWDEYVDQYFNFNTTKSFNNSNQNMNFNI